MTTLQDVFAAGKFKPSGFDYLRVLLAASVVLWHSFCLSYGDDWTRSLSHSLWRVPVFFILPAFFALSGFLVAGSLERSPLPVFVGLRAIRIFPALVVETVVSAFLIGPLLTSLPLAEYFGNSATWTYVHNVLGHDIQFNLPGLFENNPVKGTVNGQLWTVPWELSCYAVLTALALLRVDRNKYVFLVVGFLAPILLQTYYVHSHPNYVAISQLIHVSGRTLLISFLAGVLLYKFRFQIPYNLPLAFGAFVVFALGLYTRYPEVIMPLPVAYITIMIGVTDFRKNVLIKFGDLSYGIFLYGFVIEQAVAQLLPFGRVWYGNFVVSIVIAGVVAKLSWTYVEKPFQRFKKPLFAAWDKVEAFARDRVRLARA